MSYTEIFQFNKEGIAEDLGEVQNAWRGAMAIWQFLETKYLSPLPKPSWMDAKDYAERGYSRTSQPHMGGDHPLKPIWDLWKDDKVSRIDKVVLGTTFDKVVVMRNNIPEVIEAFRNFEGETSLQEQANILEEALKDDDIIAVGWNQTSVNGDNWANFNYHEEEQEHTGYNLLSQDEHWDLFEELNGEILTQ